MSHQCVFCSIIRRELPAVVIRENDHVMVIRDRAPRAPIHYLIIPKVHIDGVVSFGDDHADIAWEMIRMARDIGREVHPGKGFNLIMNEGRDAGQSVFHLHVHYMSGRNMWDGE